MLSVFQESISFSFKELQKVDLLLRKSTEDEMRIEEDYTLCVKRGANHCKEIFYIFGGSRNVQLPNKRNQL